MMINKEDKKILVYFFLVVGLCSCLLSSFIVRVKVLRRLFDFTGLFKQLLLFGVAVLVSFHSFGFK